MAATFKPIFDILSPTTHRDTIATPLVEAVSGPLRDSLRDFPYAIPAPHRQFLCDSGINLTEFGTKTHPHPVHKTIELNLLRNVWKHYATTPSSIMFMKPSKFDKLQQQNPNFQDLHNYRLTPKDTTRYPQTSPSLPTTQNIFMHDALMYYSPAQILDLFARCPSLQNLYASLVVPPESDFTHLSLNPTLYRYQFHKDDLIYHLENNPAHAYIQPRSALDWLKTSMICGNNLQLSVTILDSWGPVHSLLIQRGLTPLSQPLDKVSFKVPDAILLPEANDLRQDIRHRLVPRAAYQLLFSYVRAVRTLRVTDPAGLIRTQSNKPEYHWVTPAAWDNLQHFALHTSPHRPISHYMLFKSPIQRLRHWAKTNEFFLFALSSLAALPPCALASAYIAHLSRCRISVLRLFGRDLITPPPSPFTFRSLFSTPPPTPRFAFSFAKQENRHWKPFFSSLPLAFMSKIPHRFRHLFTTVSFKSLPSWTVPAILVSCSIPCAILAYRWFTGPDTPQSLHDQYQAYFHPDPWELTFNRKPVYTDAKAFLPFEPVHSEPLRDIPIHPLTPPAMAPAPPASSHSAPSSDDKKTSKSKKKTSFQAGAPPSPAPPTAATTSSSTSPSTSSSDPTSHPPAANPPPSTPVTSTIENLCDPASLEVLEEVFTPSTRPPSTPPPVFSDPSPIDIGSIIQGDQEGPMCFDPDVNLHPLNCECPFHFVPEDGPFDAFDLSASDPSSIHELPRDENLPALADPPVKVTEPIENSQNPLVTYAPLHPSASSSSPILVYSEKFESYINFCVANLCHLFSEEISEIGLQSTEVNPRTKPSRPSHLPRLLIRSSKFDSHIPAFAENFQHLNAEEIQALHPNHENPSASPPPPAESHASPENPAANPPLPEDTSIPDSPRSTATVDDFGVLNYVETAPPTPYQPEDHSLMSDPSGIGEAMPWELLHQKNFVDYSGTFVTRQRNGPPANLPYPPTDCMLQALSAALSIQPQALWQTICSELPDQTIDYATILRQGLNTEHLTVLATMYDFLCTIIENNGDAHNYGLQDSNTRITIRHSAGKPGHFFFPKGPSPHLSGAKPSDLAHAALRFRTSTGELLPFQRVHDYVTNLGRAKNLISNMKNGFDGVLINVNPHEPNKAREAFLTLDNNIDYAKSKRVQLIHLAGFAGCGKSYPVQKLLATPMFKHFKVAVPTTELRSEWKEAMQIKSKDNWRISTWESSLLKSAKILVIDEVYRMPRGYVDLAIHADANLEFVILLGDPLQGEYHSTHQSSSNHRLSSEIPHLTPFIDYYCLWSRRIPQDVAHFFQITSLNPEPGFHTFSNHFSNTKILANSTATASLLQQAGYPAITIASSQGSTYSCPTTINLDKHSRILSLQHSLIAITRSKKGNIFVGDRSILKDTSSSNTIFSKYFNDQTIDLADMFPAILRNLHIIREPLRARSVKLSGASPTQPSMSQVFSSDSVFSFTKHAPPPAEIHPHLLSQFHSVSSNSTHDVLFFAPNFFGDGSQNSPQISTHFLPETRRPLHYDYSSAATSNPNESANIHPSLPTPSPIYPGENFESLAAAFLPAHDPDLKEILFQDQRSNQFPYLTNAFSLGCQPLSLLAAVHSPKNDHTLLPASIEKRLRFRPTSSPYQISPKDQILGSLLFQSLCRAYKRDPDTILPFDENLYLECINVNEYSQLSSKAQSVIMANAYRSDPDWRWSAVRIFAKSQHKVNESTIFGDWKACQTLALMHDAVILLLGPVKKYQRIFDAKDRPSNLYVHASHTPSDLSRWAQNHLTHSTHLANDYTAFDQSQHGEAVVLEILKMRRLSIPEHLIEQHLHLKTNVETQFGPLTCMRLTGEPGTYDDNTDYNIAVLYSEYAITSQGVAVSGDDSLIDSEPLTRPEWGFLRPLLALRFKKERTRYGLFCGYYIGPEGAVRSPLALFAKLAIALDDASLDEKLTSYLTEFLIGHSLGQPMWNLIPIEQVMYAAANFDFFCRYTPTSLKPALHLGEPPASIINKLFPLVKHMTYPIWSLLNNGQRMLFHRNRKTASTSTMLPFESPNEGELLPSFNCDDDTIDNLSAKSDPQEVLRSLEDYPLHASHVYAPKTESEKHFKISGAGSMALPSEAIALVLKLLSGLGNAEKSAEGSGTSAPSSSLVLPPPTLPAPSRSLTSPAASSPAGITLPFQSLFFDITGTETKSTSIAVATMKAISDLLPHYRYAKLTHLEAMIAPTGNSQKYPQTIEVVWCTADQTIADDKIMQTYGSARYAFGGPVNMPVQTIHPADLVQLNPIIKDSVTYTDTPRFCLRFWENADCKKLGTAAPICGSIFIRGMVHLSSPTSSPSAV